MPRPAESALPLRLYRVLLAGGGIALLGIGLLYRLGEPDAVDPTAGRLALGLAALALGGLLVTSRWARERSLAFVYGFIALVSVWQLWLAALNGLTGISALGLVLVYFGGSVGIQSVRWLVAYSVAFVGAAAAVAFSVPDPALPPLILVATLAAMSALSAYVLRERLQALDALDEARQKALAVARAKSDFLATMSHEIRTPMNGVIGMTALLSQSRLRPDQEEYVRTIRASSESLLAIINDVLDFSKIEAQRVELETAPFALRTLVEESLDHVAAAAAAKQIELIHRVETDVPGVLVGDRARLRQILRTLLSNAVKFTTSGSVVLDVQARSLGPAHTARVELHVSVTDTGIGIRADQLDRLFLSFAHGDPATARRFGGTGLGLAIAKRLAELMEGRMWVESARGQGSTFHFTARLGAHSTDRPAHPQRADETVLVVDDHAASREALGALVREAGFEAFGVGTPADALAWIASGGRPVASVIDQDLGEASGLDLARTLRDHAALAKTPILLLSSFQRTVSDPSRVDAVLPKPVHSAAFWDLLLRLVDGEPLTSEPAPNDDRPIREGPLRVLLAEDSSVNREVALGLLRHLGLDADVAENGAAAIEAVKARRYDVVLMDIHMPDVDGLTATRRIRAELDAADQPAIVAFTANALPGDARRGLDAGMDAYLTKPVRMAELAAALEEVSGGRWTIDAPEVPAPSGDLPPTMTPDRVLAALDSLGAQDDPGFASEIIAAYLRADLLLTDALQAATDAENLDEIARIAHKFKSSSGTLGANALAQACGETERAVREGRGSDALALSRQLVADLRGFRSVVLAAQGRVGQEQTERTTP